MPLFTYTAFNKRGKEEKGLIDANNIQAARSKLKAKGLYVKNIQEDQEKKERELFPFLAKLLYRIPRKDVGIFSKQLGTLLGAGIPLDKSLSSIVDQTENIPLRKVIIQMKADITEGMSLSDSMKKYPEVFPEQYPSLISVGEQTGDYEMTLNRLADLEEKSNEIKGKVQVAMVYPFIMGGLSVLVTIFLMIVVIPQIKELFDDFEQELPPITQIVIWISDTLVSYGVWIFIGVILVIFGFVYYKNTPDGKKSWQTFVLKIPLFGVLIKKVMISNFARSLAVLLQNRVPLLSSLVIVGRIVNNIVFQREIDDAIVKVKEGGKLSDSLQNSEILPQMVIGMIAAGEVSDTVPQMMSKLAEIYEREADNTIKSLTQSLEPIMIIVMGSLIFGIMVSIMLPMYTLAQNVQKNF
jgi:general secretion pathway protein F